MWSIFLVRDWWELVDEMSRIVGSGEWVEGYGRVCKEDKVALLVKAWKDLVTVMEEVGECYVLDREVVAEKEGFVVW